MQIQPYSILLKPLVSEKSNLLRESSNQVVFEVAHEANKQSIKAAVEQAFKVTVEDVRTLIVRGKHKTVGRFQGKKSNWKKAIVSLKAGDKIDLFEGV
jgi:large subunit ribosomal protein L23